MKRPMLYWVVMFVLGEVLIGVIPITVLVIIIATAFLFCLIKGNSFKESRSLLLLGLLFLFFGMVRAELERATISLCGYEDKSLVCFSGKLVSHDVNKGRYRVRVIQINDKPVRTNIWIECDDKIKIGSKINGSGIVREYMTATNYGQFDQKSYEYSKGNILFLTKVKINHIQKPVFPLRNYLAKINEYIGKQYDARLNESDASLAKAMVLGDKASLDQGCVLIISVKENAFGDNPTDQYAVVYGYDDEGFFINDPISENHSSLKWSFEKLEGNMMAVFCMSRDPDFSSPTDASGE